MAQQQSGLSAEAHMPFDAYAWRESVLSTRSLSYISTPGASRRASLTHIQYPLPPTRRSTLTSMSDYSDPGLEMVRTNTARELNDIPELPDSVSNSILFELPREIRDRIYGFCLSTQNVGGVVEWPKERRQAVMQPQLLQVCKIVRDEAAPLLYTMNKLSFTHPSDSNMFARAFAAPAYTRLIALLELQIKAQDTRLWMPYLTSTDDKRSLQADFPSLRSLFVRYKSNRWQHSLPPEANMKPWADDPRLDEVMNGLRLVFHPPEQTVLPPPPPPPPQVHHGRLGPEGGVLGGIIGEPDFLDYVDEKEEKKRQNHSKSGSAQLRPPQPPMIRVTVACRVHATHFVALTTTAEALSTQGSRPLPDQQGMQQGTLQANASGQMELSREHAEPMGAVREGEDFRGFTPVDLRKRARVAEDPTLGSASIATTPFANKKGILLALEIYCAETRRDGQTGQG